jgi:hypothetical protein
MVMRNKPRNEELDFDYAPSSARTVKFIAAGLASIVVVGGVLGGIVYFMQRPSGGAQEAGFNMPSVTGLMVSAASGGKMSPQKWDDAMTGVCSQMAGVSILMSGREIESSQLAAVKRAQRACRNGQF